MKLNAVALGAGPPLVLLHGLFGSAGNFGTVQKRLAGTRRVVAFDLRNHGASPHAADMQYRSMAEDVRETLAAMDLLPCALLGHSMGGKVAMALALTAPDAVSRLLVADIAPVPYRPHLAAFARAMLDLALPPTLTRAQADAALAATVAEPALRAFLLHNLRLGPTPHWRIGLAEIAAAMDDIQGWPAITAAPYTGPTLFLAGARSDYIQDHHRPPIRTLFPAARFATLRNAGHWLHADDPEGFLAVVEAFCPAIA